MVVAMKEIILDIDGTLLNSQRIISPRTKQALLDAQASGVKLVLASGRPTKGMIGLAHELEMDQHDGLLVSYNGARVTDVQTNEILFDQPIPSDLVVKVLEHLKQFDAVVMINDDQYVYVNDVFSGMIENEGQTINIIQYEAHDGGFLLCEVQDLAKFATFPIPKILIAGSSEYLHSISDQIYAPFKNKLNGAFSSPCYFEFTDLGIDKAKALSIVNQKLAIAPSDVIAFGDAPNDRSIVEYAGVGVVMDNGTVDMKAIADYVTASNNEDGIAVALEKFLVVSD
ncbi:MAG: Cof-type HAD-IIB family hydrolase [Bifidobacteriaceae bacterium]|jgi:Cof subfamily protein (haloacid dehalogenase superfamily)|nr:Cof-type HAD-IIB family hydrolase [Bifidobacteriaceae bacterium]